MESNKLTKLNGQFELDNTYESNNWIRVKIRTFAFGENRNASDIKISSMSEFNNAKNTVGAVPIVARYNAEQDNLEGHNVVLRKDSQGEYEWFHDTDALGFTSPTTSFHFEDVNEGTETDPNFKTYVVVEDVYLWKRFDSTKKILEWFSNGIVPRVSMEIDKVKGEFGKDGFFQIEDFEFTGICALGSDVEPCFPKAEIQMYTLDEFKSDIKALFEELNTELSSKEGGNTKMEQETQVETETVEQAEFTEETPETVIEEVETTENKTDVVEETFEEIEVAETATEEVETETSTETEQVEEAQTEFALTSEQLKHQLRSALSNEKYIDRWGDSCRRYWYVDYTSEVVIYEDSQNNDQLFSAEYTLNGDNVVVNFASAKKVKIEYVPFETAEVFTINTDKFESIKSTLTTELEALKEYKRTREEQDLRSQFDGQLAEDELNAVFEENQNSTLEEIETKVYALIGKKNFSRTETKPTNKIGLDLNKEVKTDADEPYNGLFSKYLNNK